MANTNSTTPIQSARYAGGELVPGDIKSLIDNITLISERIEAQSRTLAELAEMRGDKNFAVALGAIGTESEALREMAGFWDSTVFDSEIQ